MLTFRLVYFSGKSGLFLDEDFSSIPEQSFLWKQWFQWEVSYATQEKGISRLVTILITSEHVLLNTIMITSALFILNKKTLALNSSFFKARPYFTTIYKKDKIIYNDKTCSVMIDITELLLVQQRCLLSTLHLFH